MPGTRNPINEFVRRLEPSRKETGDYVQLRANRVASCIQLGSPIERYDMLILTRRVGQRVFIGSHVTLTVVSISGTEVRFEINAPKYVSVDRAQIHARRALEKVEAAK